ncbi:Regulatory subunit Dfp1/Him1, central region [Cordyceps fumosorosea ARSEF 2679]|uniref:Regulatory subunit Dfp1/Him1, central region n=1 Tax=Cordyceps fumosorosea (strain ARSEF 2679) TaxID=1081104 RepID=A0A167WIC2_CORFA|nr:Regulatory subunit Dfp1/Him1, central region [Cordyceps fumosorosea ARSEF 2679]OAA63827.1 Regulatory subunit Dfp1/Him1, central region [Cordyceps fumosorosea ARSEF 2679]
MASRRVPLSNNPNVANSPLRGASALAAYAKQKRSYATIQREEAYGQAPPVKKQALDSGAARVIRSPSKLPRAQTMSRVATAATARPVVRDRQSRAAPTAKPHDVESEKEVWKRHHRAKFPKMVFYFESIPDDVRAKLIKRVTYLGARQEPFFSIDVTHVVTTRSIPVEKTGTGEADALNHEQSGRVEEQPQTINPSLLLDKPSDARRKLLFDFRQAPMQSLQQDDLMKRTRGVRNNDVLHKARDMGKKIWSLDKFQTMLAVLLESETQQAAYGSRVTNARSQYGANRGAHEPNLLQLLHNERINGPSDRDPTAISRELSYFKGPYLYVWDMDEKQKPMMVREYSKVINKADGDWPQFRSVGNGRCPFVEELELPEREVRKNRERERARVIKREEHVTILKPPENPLPRPVTGKRSLAEMEGGHNRPRGATTAEVFNPAKAAIGKHGEMRPQNAFISRADSGRQFAGEPVASGMQPSNITSAIRSQMISSTSGINGAKAGTSKAVHGLQRKVLQKAAPASYDLSSRHVGEIPVDVASSRSTTMSRQNSKLTAAGEDDNQKAAETRERKATSQLKSKKDLKPGYCENCQDKFRDFDEHIASRKHRKFAENHDNWSELDALLSQLERPPRFAAMDSEEY